VVRRCGLVESSNGQNRLTAEGSGDISTRESCATPSGNAIEAYKLAQRGLYLGL
jgi:hypothetical protein